MSDDLKSCQFQRLNTFRKEHAPVHVYLLSGTRFTGRIRSFDVHTVLLETQHGEMVIYGHAISTIEPAQMSRGRRPGDDQSGRHHEEAGSAGYRGPPAVGGAIHGGRARSAGVDGRNGLRRDAYGAEHGRELSDRPLSSVKNTSSNHAPAPEVTIVRRRSRLLPKE